MSSKLTNTGGAVSSEGHASMKASHGIAETFNHLTKQDTEFLQAKMKAFEHPNDITIGCLTRIKDLMQELTSKYTQTIVNGEVVGRTPIEMSPQTKKIYHVLLSHVGGMQIVQHVDNLPSSQKHDKVMSLISDYSAQGVHVSLLFPILETTS